METTEISPEELQRQEAARANFFDFNKAKVRIDKLIGEHASYILPRTLRNRNARYIDLDVEVLRQNGSLQQDETMVPCRVMDSNIKRDKAEAMAFLNSNARLAYFRCLTDPAVDTRELESDVTKGLTYKGWYNVFDQHYDGAALHAYDAIEVLYDEEKPAHVAFSHVGYDNLIFNLRVKNIQSSTYVIIADRVTVLDLQELVANDGWNAEQVAKITQDNKLNGDKNDDKIYNVYKVRFKFEGYVYIAYYSKDGGPTGWLKDPQCERAGLLEKLPDTTAPSSIGTELQGDIQGGAVPEVPLPIYLMQSDVPGYAEKKLTQYPVFLYIYIEDEQAAICDKKGRAFLDMPQQEAVTAVTSGFVNSTIKASNIFVAPRESNEENVKYEELTLEAGSLLPVPVDFFHMPYPDPTVLTGLQYLDAANSKQTGKMAVAVSNRKDSRKTAKELDLAEGEQTKISSVSLATYSDFLRELYSFCWEIVQAQALANMIPLCLISTTTTDPLTGASNTEWHNDFELIGKEFDVRAAGDIDVVQKQEQIAAMQQDWPVFQNTGLAQAFLEEYIRVRYPVLAEKFITALRAGDPGRNIVSSLMEVVKGSLQPEELKSLAPEQKQQLEQIMMTAQAYVNPQPVKAA